MKTILSLALLGLSVSVNAADLASPILLKPDNGANLPLKKSAKFTWQKVTGATRYQIIFSAEKNFTDFDFTKNKCLKATSCLSYSVVSPSYQFASSNDILKFGGNYFWQVRAINKTQSFSNSEIRAFSIGMIVPPAIERVSVNPQPQLSLGNSVRLIAVLNKSLPVGYSVQIKIDDNFQKMTGSNTEFSFNFIPTEDGDLKFQIAIFDKNNIMIDSFNDSFRTWLTTPSTITMPTYTKIANDGSVLPDNAILGKNPTDWACTKDNETGLIWEVKTNDGGLRAVKNTYSWYNPDSKANGGFEGYKNNSYANDTSSICRESECDTYAFVNAVNKQSLCGANNWRLPTKDELTSLVYCSNGQYQALDMDSSRHICRGSVNYPMINTMYFPDVSYGAYWFWSSTPSIYFKTYSHFIAFTSSLSDISSKDNALSVRLVSGGQ